MREYYPDFEHIDREHPDPNILPPEEGEEMWMAHFRPEDDPHGGSMDGDRIKCDGSLLDAAKEATEYARKYGLVLQCLRRRY